MRGRTIFWYLFRQNLKTSILVLGLLTMIAVLGQFADASRYLRGGAGQTVPGILWIALLRTPALILPILPHVILISAAVTVYRLGRRLEQAVILQSGMSSFRILLPLALCGAVLGAVYVLAVNPLASAGYRAAQSLASGADPAPGDSRMRNAARQIVIRDDTGLRYVFIENLSVDGDLLQGVTVFHIDRNHRLARRLDAKAAEWTGESWRLSGSRVTAVPGDRDGEDIGLELDRDLLDREMESRFASPVYSLPDQIAYAASIGAVSNSLQMQFHGLIALPALLAAIAFLGGAFVIRPLVKGEWKRDVLVVLAAAFAIYTLATVVDALGVAGSVSAVAASWSIPVLCFLVGLAVILLKETRL